MAEYLSIPDAAYYQIPEFGASCRTSSSGVRYKVEDVLVGARKRAAGKIGGSAKKCLTGLTCKYEKGGFKEKFRD